MVNLGGVTTIIEPDHNEDYSDGEQQNKQPEPGLLTKRLSMVEDKKLRQALNLVRGSNEDRELKEECIRTEWYQVQNDQDRGVLRECVADRAFWDEVKKLAEQELETEPQTMGEAQFRAMFREFDADGSGAIDADELRKLLEVAMGMECSAEEVLELMAQVDSDGNGEIDEEEFMEIMAQAKKQQESTARSLAKGGGGADFLETSVLKKARATKRHSLSPHPKHEVRRTSTSAFVAQRAAPVAADTTPIPETPVSSSSPTRRASRFLDDSSGDEERESSRLLRKASMTDNAAKREQLKDRASMEEFKEMLAHSARSARREAEAESKPVRSARKATFVDDEPAPTRGAAYGDSGSAAAADPTPTPAAPAAAAAAGGGGSLSLGAALRGAPASPPAAGGGDTPNTQPCDNPEESPEGFHEEEEAAGGGGGGETKVKTKKKKVKKVKKAAAPSDEVPSYMRTTASNASSTRGSARRGYY